MNENMFLSVLNLLFAFYHLHLATQANHNFNELECKEIYCRLLLKMTKQTKMLLSYYSS